MALPSWTWRTWDRLGRDELYELLALRCRVFILEQGPYLDPDGLDRHAHQLMGRDAAGELVAGLRLLAPGTRYAEPSIGRVVTAARLRGTGVGRALMVEGLRGAGEVYPGQPVRISAQAHLQRFYGSLGFAAVGEPYLEDGIPHLEMLRPGAP